MAALVRGWPPGRAGLVVLAAVLVAVPLLAPNRFYLELAVAIGLNALVCVGLNLLIGHAGQISLGHAGFVGLGAYAVAVGPTHLGLPPFVALLAGLGLAGGLAFAVGRPILKLKGHYLAMATLGLGLLVFLVLTNEREWTAGPDGMAVPRLVVAGVAVRGPLVWYAVVAGALWLGVALALNLIASPLGRALRALHDSEVAAAVAGVDVARAKLVAFVVSALYAALAGGLGALYAGFVTPDRAGFLSSIALVTMVVLGGLGSTFGAVVGAAVLTALPQGLVVFHDYEQALLGLVLMGVMIFLRRGLVPSLHRAWRGAGR